VSGPAEVIDAARPESLDGIEPALRGVFLRARAALADGLPVVVVVRDEDLLGHGDPAAAAVAGGVLGLVRALAMEGARDGWAINALAVTEAVDAADRARWIDRLGEPDAATGAVVRLGRLHHGRIPV
jgi:NAD(P)-dependent dehydrogenase (short-subunit alcohol dehydrogenase family)